MSEKNQRKSPESLIHPLGDLRSLYSRVENFHGHRCPGSAYGLRVAIAGLSHAGNHPEDLLKVHSRTRMCAIDAIQVLTGCTVGNGQLVIRDTSEHEFIFWNETNASGCKIRVRKVLFEDTKEEIEAMKRFGTGDRSLAVCQLVDQRREKRIDGILSLPESEILEIESLENPPGS